MKFIYADSIDVVDPNYDFEKDLFGKNREPYWSDVFPHEIMDEPPYDGLLVSRGIVGDHLVSGIYSMSQAMRFKNVGARKFLRYDKPQFKNNPIFGDCGAFSYHKMDEPPYEALDTVEFYSDGGFTHGCSIDHIIFEFDDKLKGMEGGSENALKRYNITLDLAKSFFDESKQLGNGFTAIGVVQGWSPGSMANAAKKLVSMGYEYIAMGGMVPLSAPAIKLALQSVRKVIPKKVKIHILGFAKAEQIHEFRELNIASFDSTSPLLRAFKDSKRNYYLPKKKMGLNYYSAIRIPQATGNEKLKRLVKAGIYKQEDLISQEKKALIKIRAYDKGEVDIEETLQAIMAYTWPLLRDEKREDKNIQSKLDKIQENYRHTLSNRPWMQCQCSICRALSIEVVIFRASNRNKRRGIHNLGVFYQYLKDLEAD
jgi:hypothetical protein